jgi:succinoglycan biosynthesis protein ExoM
MLKDCLASLVAQRLPDDRRLDLVVVDNDLRPDARDIVAEFAADAPIAIHYCHEPAPGIAIARNRAITLALELDADWIAFIDDDETATPTWLADLLAAATTYDADVVQGDVKRLYPQPLPLFVMPYQPGGAAEGARLSYVSTNSVLFKSWLVSHDQAALRFDETFGFGKGEDVDFFLRAQAVGAKTVQTCRSVVHEAVPRERLTLRSQMKQYTAEVAALYIVTLRNRRPYLSPFKAIAKIGSRLAIGCLYLVSAPFCLLAGADSFGACVARGARRFSWAAGIAHGMKGNLVPFYRRIDGH